MSTTPTNPINLYAYIRVSSIDQAEHGFSLETQWKRVEAYKELLALRPGLAGLRLAQAFEETGQSAYRIPLIQRRQGRLLNEILQPGDHVAFVRMDRAFRNVRDLNETRELWELRGITIHFVDQMLDLSTANGKMLANVLVSIAQWESDIKSERMVEVFKQLKADGRLAQGPPPAGFKRINKGKKKKITVPNREQWPIVRLISLLRHKGISWPQISDRVEALLAKREGREPYGRIDWGQGKKRQWSQQRCKRAYETRQRLGLR